MTTFVWTAVTIEAVQKAARAKDAERTRLAALATTTGGRSGHRLHLLAKPIDPSQIVSIPVSCTSRTHRITGAAWKVSPNSYHSWTTDTTGVANNVLGCLSWTCILCTSHGPYGSGSCRFRPRLTSPHMCRPTSGPPSKSCTRRFCSRDIAAIVGSLPENESARDYLKGTMNKVLFVGCVDESLQAHKQPHVFETGWRHCIPGCGGWDPIIAEAYRFKHLKQ